MLSLLAGNVVVTLSEGIGTEVIFIESIVETVSGGFADGTFFTTDTITPKIKAIVISDFISLFNLVLQSYRDH